jgi:hypothetical protein
MEYLNYIPLNAYEEAQKHGIGKFTLENRVKNLGWDVKRAVNTPPRKQTMFPEWAKELASKNGISYHNLVQRVTIYKWDLQKAATEPIKK